MAANDALVRLDMLVAHGLAAVFYLPHEGVHQWHISP